VLVVGGGPAGTAAAIAAGRLGANVLLVERYNHLGGLSTGGLVIWIDRMTDWSGRQVIRGLADELMERLPKDAIQGPPRADWGNRDAATAAYWAQRTAAYHGIVTWSPTIDPEALKTLSLRMAEEAKVQLLLHAWCTAPIIEDGVVRGVIFESKEGRHAILAKVVIDTPGDADLIARSGARCESDVDASDIHHCMNTCLPARRRRYGTLARFPQPGAGLVYGVHGTRSRPRKILREAVRVVAQRRGIVLRSAACRLQRSRCRGLDHRRIALA
jgi:hypothetical protein